MGSVEEEEEVSNTESDKDYLSDSDDAETESNGKIMLFQRIWIPYDCASLLSVLCLSRALSLSH